MTIDKSALEVLATYERAGRIFSGLPITCHAAVGEVGAFNPARLFEGQPGPPAWSVGPDIYFRLDVAMKSLTRSGELAFAGLNFHELGHALYTPQPDSWLREQIKHWDGVWQAFNVLEDQRIESLLAARYPTVAGYFVHAFESFVLENQKAVYTNHLLAHGRRFLAPELRAVLRDEFVGSWDERDGAEALIDEYRTLVIGPDRTRDAERACTLVSTFARILHDLGEHIPCRAHGRNYGGVVTTAAQLDAQQARDLLESGQLEPGGTVLVLDGDRMRPARRAGRRNRPPRSTRARRNRRGILPLERSHSLAPAPVPPGYVDASRQFRTELERIRSDADAGWVRRQACGRLNTQRVMLGAGAEVAFDRWDSASRDASDIEAVILVDSSLSMLPAMSDACGAAWAIKRAVEAVRGRVTVLSYAESARLVYGADERADAGSIRSEHAEGGTDPAHALSLARQLLVASTSTNRMLITLTDGAWANEDAAHEHVDAMNTAGVTTALGLLGEQLSLDPHHHRHSIRLADAAALVGLARELVRAAAT